MESFVLTLFLISFFKIYFFLLIVQQNTSHWTKQSSHICIHTMLQFFVFNFISFAFVTLRNFTFFYFSLCTFNSLTKYNLFVFTLFNFNFILYFVLLYSTHKTVLTFYFSYWLFIWIYVDTFRNWFQVY